MINFLGDFTFSLSLCVRLVLFLSQRASPRGGLFLFWASVCIESLIIANDCAQPTFPFLQQEAVAGAAVSHAAPAAAGPLHGPG